METLLLPFFNFAILVSLLVFFTRKPVIHFVQNRHDVIKADLQEARTSLKNSQEKFEDFSSRLRALDAEVSSLRDQATREASEMQKRILNSAKESSGSLVVDAKASAESMFYSLRAQLVRELGEQIVAQSEEMIRKDLTGDVRKRIRTAFSSGIGGMNLKGGVS